MQFVDAVLILVLRRIWPAPRLTIDGLRQPRWLTQPAGRSRLAILRLGFELADPLGSFFRQVRPTSRLYGFSSFSLCGNFVGELLEIAKDV